MDNPKKKWLLPAIGLVILFAGVGDVVGMDDNKKEKKDKQHRERQQKKSKKEPKSPQQQEKKNKKNKKEPKSSQQQKKAPQEKSGWEKLKDGVANIFSGSSSDEEGDTPQVERHQEEVVEGDEPEEHQPEVEGDDSSFSDDNNDGTHDGDDASDGDGGISDDNQDEIHQKHICDMNCPNYREDDPPLQGPQNVVLGNPGQQPEVKKPAPPPGRPAPKLDPEGQNPPPDQREGVNNVYPGPNDPVSLIPDPRQSGNGDQPPAPASQSPVLTSGPPCGPVTWLSAAVVVTVLSYISWRKFFAKKVKPAHKPKPKPDSTPRSSEDEDDQKEE